jgi:hypothetical protein
MPEIIDLVEEPPKGLPRWILISLGVSGIALLWAFIFYLVNEVLSRGVAPISGQNAVSDLATLLFGASGITLAIFSLVVGGVAVAGWNTIKEGVRKDVETTIRSDISQVEKELRGRVLANVGMVLGLFYARTHEQVLPGQVHDDARARAERDDYLAEVVEHCLRAYKMLKEVKSVGQFMALNNYVYFSCLHGRPSSRIILLEMARELRRVGEERGYWDALLTYCLAIDKFSDVPEDLRTAAGIALELKEKGNLTDRQRREAASLATSLLSRPTNQVSTGPRT